MVDDSLFESRKLPKVMPIQYDYNNLKLNLYSSILDSTSTIKWKWDHMNSSNKTPDYKGVEYFENREQSIFEYNGFKSLPTLTVKTDNSKIVAFSATTLFTIEDTSKQTIKKLLSSLPQYNLLQDSAIKSELLQNNFYESDKDGVIESISIINGKEGNEYYKISYSIEGNHSKKP